MKAMRGTHTRAQERKNCSPRARSGLGDQRENEEDEGEGEEGENDVAGGVGAVEVCRWVRTLPFVLLIMGGAGCGDAATIASRAAFAPP